MKTLPVEIDIVDRLVKKFGALCKEEGVDFQLGSVNFYKALGHTSVNFDLHKNEEPKEEGR